MSLGLGLSGTVLPYSSCEDEPLVHEADPSAF